MPLVRFQSIFITFILELSQELLFITAENNFEAWGWRVGENVIQITLPVVRDGFLSWDSLTVKALAS